ncbi:hypothetical protein [Gemmatimonas sp.]|uniref:hypothetical protein n=1 Tax=Gemmatimonas sp. TaxID=1962908 RepID=UPI00286DFECC|nr:hypothetical protein [Gemmatimonas sp.]
MRRLVTLAGAVLLSTVPTSAARAQTAPSDSTGFRAGQWGAEFTLGTGSGAASGVGALRFFSDRRALLLDVNGRLTRASGDAWLRSDESSLHVRIGPRWYRPVKGRVLQYVSLGVIASHDRREIPVFSSSLDPMTRSTTKSFGAGTFGEVGGSWMVTPQLRLGASWQGVVQYARQTQDARNLGGAIVVPASRSNVWNASFGSLALRAGVFF